jgi:hypothetical protein
MKAGSVTDEGADGESGVGANVGSEIIMLDVAELDVTDLEARLRRVTATTSDPYQVC